ncbi:hypothetical protein CSPX01_17355 [Colletotrichum filicis]|nr:hypothetical protein CSPX01_17355 [Colletotrichum filicis]
MPGQCHVLHPFRRYDCGATVQTIASGVILLTRTELMERRLSVRQLPASRPAKYGLMLGSLHSGMTGDRHDAIQRTKPAAHSPRTPTDKLPTYPSHLHATQHSVIAQQALGLAFLTNQGTVSNRSTMIRRGQVLLPAARACETEHPPVPPSPPHQESLILWAWFDHGRQ